jgi:MFS family permease
VNPLRRLSARHLHGTVLGLRDFRLLWLGQTVSTVGDQIFPVAVTISVLDAGGGASDVGLVLAARWLALVLFVLAGGVWADRLPRRRVLMGSDGFRAVAVGALILLPEERPLWLLATMVFVVGGGEAFFRPAYGALLPSLLPPERRAAGNALTSVSVRTGAIVGPGLGAAVVTAAGTRWAFALTVVGFLFSLSMLARLREPPFTPDASRSMVEDIREGFAEVWARTWVAVILGMAAVQLMVSVAPSVVLLPVISRREFHTDAVFGTALALMSAGGLLGALVAMRWRPRHPGLVALLGLVPYVLIPLALLYPVSRWWVFAAYFLAGIGLEPFVILWQVALQREIPPDRLARITALDWLSSFALMPLGLALTGPAVDAVGERAVLVVAGVMMVVPTLLVLRIPGMKDFRTPGKEQVPVASASPVSPRPPGHAVPP